MFKIGDFSHIARVSTRTLRYYDQIGLFNPAHVDEQSGYRLYSADQLPDLNRILALRDMGFGLEEIRPLLGRGVSTDELRGMLALRRSAVEREIEDQIGRLRLIETRIEAIDIGEPDVELIERHEPSRHFLSIREQCSEARHAIEVMTEIAQVAGTSRGLAALWLSSYSDAQLDVRIGILDIPEPTLQLRDGRELEMSTLAATDVVSITRTGPPELAHALYGAVGRLLEDRHRSIAGAIREIVHQLPDPERDVEPVVEVLFPVS